MRFPQKRMSLLRLASCCARVGVARRACGGALGLPAGKGLYIVVNANAKRGGRRIAVQIARALPGATRATHEEHRGDRGLAPHHRKEPRCILSAGGDGSAVALLNALDRVIPKGEPFPAVGALPLGTGNAWAHALGARKLDGCVQALARHDDAMPTKRYGLLTCDGTLTFFAGCGWDAQVLDDYRLQLEASPSSRVAKSVWGYLSAMLFAHGAEDHPLRTAARHRREPRRRGLHR